LFDGNFDDVYGFYDGILVTNNGSSWKSPGYAGYGSAAFFSRYIYSFVNHSLNLMNTSFTISAWIWMPFNFTLSGAKFFVLFSQCQQTTDDNCMHLVINNGSLYLGFFGDDLQGNTKLQSNQWLHVAFVYNRPASQQLVYLNGIQDGNRTAIGKYNGSASPINLGAVPQIGRILFHSGFIDKLTFVSRVKNASELLDEATLVAYYPFDGSYLDSGPNNINNNNGVFTTFNSSGRFGQALMINSANSSYFQTTGFYYLGLTNYPYSFSLWIYPFINNGTILQVIPSYDRI
jgi:hypothetical protein